jgi:hypothetical protein
MRKILLPSVAFLCLFLPPPLRAAEPQSPGVLVRVRSLDSLLADLKHLASVSGRDDLFQQFDGLFKVRGGGKGVEGIDPAKPLGLYGDVGPNGIDSTVVALVPVADEKAFLDLLTRFGVKVEKGKGGLYTGKLANVPIGLSLRFAEGYAYLTPGDESVLNKDTLLSPARVFPPGAAALFSFVLRVDQIGDDLKQLGMVQVGHQLAMIRDKDFAGGTAAQGEFWKQAFEELGNLARAVLRDGRQLEVRFDVDRKSGELSADVSLDGKPQSKLTGTIEELGRSRSLFSGIASEGSALHGLIDVSLPESARKALAAVIDDGIAKALEKEPKGERRDKAAEFLKVVTPSLKAGELDGVVDLQVPAGEGKTQTLLVGVKLKDGPAVEQALRDLVKGLPQGDRDRIQFDADKVSDVNIHRVNVQKDLDERGKKAFGDHPAYVAFRADVLLLALGEDGLARLKEAVTAAPRTGPQVLFEVSVARLAPVVALEHGQDVGKVTKAVQEAFAERGSDRVRFTAEGGSALKVHFDMKTAVLKFAALLDRGGAKEK